MHKSIEAINNRKEEGSKLAGIKYFPWQMVNRRSVLSSVSERKAQPGVTHFMSALKAFLMVPLFPVLGYCLLDQTGFSQTLVKTGFIPTAILGEGFGHVGLCFSLHYVLDGFRGVIKGVQALLR